MNMNVPNGGTSTVPPSFLSVTPFNIFSVNECKAKLQTINYLRFNYSRVLLLQTLVQLFAGYYYYLVSLMNTCFNNYLFYIYIYIIIYIYYFILFIHSLDRTI